MRTITLRIESPGAAPAERTCGAEGLTFGRAADVDVVCADIAISRRHARVVLDAGAFFVEDIGGRNGTFLNGEQIRGRARLADGDAIQMGSTVVHVVDPQTAENAPPPAELGGLVGTSIFRTLDDIADHAAAGDAAPARLAARLNALTQFHRSLAGAIALDTLLEQLLQHLFAVLRPEEGVILLREADGTLRTAASRRLPGAAGDLLVSRRLVEEVIDKRTAALVTDVAIDERFAESQSVLGAGVRSILAAPFSDAEGCVGMVAIDSRTTVRRFGEEDLDLLVSLATAAALRIRNVSLAEAEAARRVEDRELALAHDIQMGMLPRNMPSRPEIDVAATMIPARAVGGDLYDFLVVDDSLWFIVADAAGKGVSAALFMAVTRTLFRALARAGTPVSSVMERMNAELSRDNERQFFVTALIGRLSLGSGELTCCNAGHPPMMRAAVRRAPEALAAGGAAIALGILADATYPEACLTLAPGDVILLFTDGVTEAVNPDGELFGDVRLIGALGQSASERASVIVERVAGAVNTFAARRAQEDDITVLALRYNGGRSATQTSSGTA